MLKKIILTIFILFITLTPISALTISQNAYNVPWSQTDNYIITNNNGILTAFVSTHPLMISTVNQVESILFTGGFTLSMKEIYQYINNQWQQLGSGIDWNGSATTINGIVFIRIFNTNIPIEMSFLSNNIILYSNFDVRTPTTILFQQAPFQLQLSPQQIREGATLEGLNQLIQRISMDSLQILLIGLLALSSLLVIPLIKRFWGLIRL